MLSIAYHIIINHLMGTGNSATSNNIKLVHWPLMGWLLHSVQRGEARAEPQPTQRPPCCFRCNSPSISGQCTNHCIAQVVRCSVVLMCPLKG